MYSSTHAFQQRTDAVAAGIDTVAVAAGHRSLLPRAPRIAVSDPGGRDLLRLSADETSNGDISRKMLSFAH
jgi:hypothetical protein